VNNDLEAIQFEFNSLLIFRKKIDMTEKELS